MLPPAGASKAERWVAAGRRACALDLAVRLQGIERIQRVFALVADEADCDELRDLGVQARLTKGESFEFGHAISDVIRERGIKQMAYFGGASAPLLDQQSLELMIDQVLSAPGGFGIANNLHSTDWIILNDATAVGAHSHRLPADNPLGWVLSKEAGLHIMSTEPSAGTRLDIDTPTDLFMARGHPGAGPALSEFLEDIPADIEKKLSVIRDIMQTPASTLAVIGRTSAHAWQTLVQQTQIWVRLFVEERGMVASHRLAKGEVRSLIGQMLDDLGPENFVQRLSGMSDAVLWDTRVWMGTFPKWPTDADRFGADLGWIDSIENGALRELTSAIQNSSIPILQGGYGVVGGGLYALLESLEQG